MSVRWRVQCSLCGQRGSTTQNTDGEKPKHRGAMTGKCPKNPGGGNFGHKPIWIRD